MRTVIKLHFQLFFVLCSVFAKADSWIPKSDFPNTVAWAISFSVDGKGYVGAGEDYFMRKDFWEYDPVANTWTQKADYGGGRMSGGCSFAIGNLGYAGMGLDSMYQMRQDFWEYNPSTNFWKQRADFAGSPRAYLTVFTFANMGYACMGYNGFSGNFNDMWQYDPVTDIWTQKTSMPTQYPREGANAFVIANIAYIAGGTGSFAGGNGAGIMLNDFWEYNITTDTWLHKPDFPFAPRSFCISFTLCEKGYLGTGNLGDGFNYFSDFWEYEPFSGTWTQKTSFPSPGRMASAGFIIDNRAFIGVGVNHVAIFDDFYEYIPDNPCATGIDELSHTGLHLTVSPNPANEMLIINYQLNKDVNATITDINGKVMKEFLLSANSDHITISLRNFANGIYFIRVKNEVKKFVKE